MGFVEPDSRGACFTASSGWGVIFHLFVYRTGMDMEFGRGHGHEHTGSVMSRGVYTRERAYDHEWDGSMHGHLVTGA